MSEIARQLGKLGGSVKSKAKAKAARQNGKLGGRPKTCPKANPKSPYARHQHGISAQVSRVGGSATRRETCD